MTEQHGMAEKLIDLLGAYTVEILNGTVLNNVSAGDITSSQTDALQFIERHSGCSTTMLAEGLRISIPSATRLVDRLVKKEALERKEYAEDRRQLELYLTDLGREIITEVRTARYDRVQKALNTLVPTEREIFIKLLEKFIKGTICDISTLENICLHCGTEHDEECIVGTMRKQLGNQKEEIW
jgi:DNA-binding MarR family transcriptional regulator